MNLRRRCLPPGWYPSGEDATRRKIENLAKGLEIHKAKALAGIVPHAGWEFSGRGALQVVQSVAGPIDTVVVVGGHLPPQSGVYAAVEDAYETPLGPLSADRELLDFIKKETRLRKDSADDNTVEIQLPFIRFVFPQAKALWLRSSPSQESVELGETLARAARSLKKNILVIGSTDLTHYGSNYGFSPAGRGEAAVRWVKEVNDKNLIDSLLALDLTGALAKAEKDSSACSIGGAVAAASYARACGITGGTLLSHYTSYDIYPHESFVGYAGIIYA